MRESETLELKKSTGELKEAFREAIINAFCHRNYYLYDSVNIAIFKDKLEMRNPGLLYGGLTIERITKGGGGGSEQKLTSCLLWF